MPKIGKPGCLPTGSCGMRWGPQYQWSERFSLGGNFEYVDLGKGKINNKQTLKGDYKRNEIFFLGLNANWTF